ncbi:MAG: hypothetical protein IPH64_16250 [Comamonadaceae bacterium]|nr:hypothetical protein [Comamonadaceae bacterium]
MILRSHDAMVGEIPDEAARWRRRHNYYLNCLRDADRNTLAELEAWPADRTICTADHGDWTAPRTPGRGTAETSLVVGIRRTPGAGSAAR